MSKPKEFKTVHCCNTSIFDLKGREECEPHGMEAGWYILGLTEHVGNKTKIPGGQNNEEEVGQPEKTACREFEEETRFRFNKPMQVADIPSEGYNKYFYLATDFQDVGPEYGLDHLQLGKSRTVTEPDQRVLTIRWYRIEEFSAKLLVSHREGFMAAMKKQAELSTMFKEYLLDLAKSDSKFYLDNLVMLDTLSQEAA